MKINVATGRKVTIGVSFHLQNAQGRQKSSVQAEKVIKGTKNVSFLHGQQDVELLAFDIITCAKQDVTLLSAITL